MKRSGKQLRDIINTLNAEIRERYPNLYRRMTRFYVRKILKDLYETSEEYNMQQSIVGISNSGNSLSDAFSIQKNNGKKYTKLPGKNKIGL